MLQIVTVAAVFIAVATSAPQFNFGTNPFASTNALGLAPRRPPPGSNVRRVAVVRPLFRGGNLRRQYQQQGVGSASNYGDPAFNDAPVAARPYGSSANSNSASAGQGMGAFGPINGASGSSASADGSARGTANGSETIMGFGNVYGANGNSNSGTVSNSDSNTATGSETITGDGYVNTASYGSSSSSSSSQSNSNVGNRVYGKK